MQGPQATPTRADRLRSRFEEALAQLEGAASFAKGRYQEDLFSLASDLMDSDVGLAVLVELAPRFDAAGVFRGGPWENPATLIPSLVGASLRGDGVYPTVESLSMLRVLAIAEGRAESEQLDVARARDFLNETSARNIQYFLDEKTEESRARPKLFRRARRLFERIQAAVEPRLLLELAVEEMRQLAAQRPILTRPVRELVKRAVALQELLGEAAVPAEIAHEIDRFRRSMGAATSISAASEGPLDYRKRILDSSLDVLVEESREFAELLRATGLASPFHAILLRRIAARDPARLGEALRGSETAEAESRRCPELAGLLLGHSLVPHTHFVIPGFARVLERNLLSRTEVAGGLRKIADLDIRPEVRELLLAGYPESAGLTANAVLLAGCLAVLGLPLGIGQGSNPTCQSARGISLWSQHAPGQLLATVASVARDGFYQTTFEGHTIRSDALLVGVATNGIQRDLDPVSQVLVPHLDRVYNHMMALAGGRSEDGHRWVNPVLYGRWVHVGFASALEAVSGAVLHHESFVRRFYATHHPDHNEGHELIYPNPVGIMITDVHARLLGRHAVSIQRIAVDPSDEAAADPVRVYFYNPNNEGRQDWGSGVRPTVAGHGERHGESSLPFGQFTSRLYAFHYDPKEQGDAFAVPSEIIDSVVTAARESWGRSIDHFA